MSKTLSDYVDIVQDTVDTTSSSDQEVIEQAIKETYQEVLHQTHKYLVGTTTEDKSTVVGTSGYATTSDIMEVYSVYYKDTSDSRYTKLIPISETDYLENWINTSNSTPQRYYIKGSSVYLSPAPAEVGDLRIVYVAAPAELETGVTSLIPDRYTRVINYGASSKFLAFEKDPAADAYERYFLNALNDMVLELKNKQETLEIKFFGRRKGAYNRYNYYSGMHE